MIFLKIRNGVVGMMVNKYILIIISLILTFITNNILSLGFIKGGLITIGLVVLGYIVYINNKQTKRYRILEDDLDPEAFINATHDAYKYAGENRQLNSLFNMDMNFAEMSLGNYTRAMEYLEKVELEKLPRSNGLDIAYYTSLMIGYYSLGQADRAREAYEMGSKIPLKNQAHKHMRTIMDANKYFYEGDYDKSRELFKSYPREKVTRRLELEILYMLASMDELEEREDEARLKYERVANKANKLNIAKLAGDKLVN